MARPFFKDFRNVQIYREDMVSLTVPTGAPVRCCDCPDHWQSNYVAAAWTSPRLSVYDVADNHFDISYEDVMVSVQRTCGRTALHRSPMA